MNWFEATKKTQHQFGHLEAMFILTYIHCNPGCTLEKIESELDYCEQDDNYVSGLKEYKVIRECDGKYYSNVN